MRTAFELDSFNELTLKGYVWKTTDEPRGLFVIAHGMAETILRYEAFAAYLCEHGFWVYGYSHRGHFETAGSYEKLGYIGKNGWHKMSRDLATVVDYAKSTKSNIPLFLMGHSMGSYLVRTYLLENSDIVDGIILSGTGFPNAFELKMGAYVAGIERLFKGKDLPSKRMDKLSFGSFNQKFKPALTPFDWLSRDAEQVRAYIENPWCGQIHPSSFFEEMANGLYNMLYRQMPQPRKKIPMFVMSGDKDPVGQMGTGVKKSADYYKDRGYDVSLKLYPEGRHEMLNEVNRAEVYADILGWVNRHLQ